MICNVFNAVTNECVDTYDLGDDGRGLVEWLAWKGYVANGPGAGFYLKVYV